MLAERMTSFDEILKDPERFFKANSPGFDNDGVICDLRAKVLEYVNAQLGTSYRDVDIRHWHSVTDWASEAGWTPERARELEEYVWFDPKFLGQVDVVPGARKLTDFLISEEVGFKIVTSRKPDLIKSTLDWYREKLPDIPKENIIIWPVVEMDGGILKAFNINRLGLGAMFEDVPGQAQDILEYSDAKVFLLSNIGRLDGMYPDRLYRIGGVNGNVPNLELITQKL